MDSDEKGGHATGDTGAGRSARWAACKAELARELGAQETQAWLTPLTLVTLTPRRVVLGGVPNAFFRSRIQRLFARRLLAVLEHHVADKPFVPEVELHLQLEDQGAPDAASRSGSAPPPPPENAQPALAAGSMAAHPLPDATFERFFEAPGNAEALAYARMVCEAPGRAYNPLLLVGPPGSGKTHLLHAIAHALAARPGGPVPLLHSGESFRHAVLEAIRRRNLPPLQQTLRAAPALLLDHADVLETTPRSQEELVQVIDALHQAGRLLVLTLDRPPRDLPKLNPSLRSRLEMGLQADLFPPDADATLAILRQHCAVEGIVLPEPDLRALAQAAQGDLRRLLGLVMRIRARSALRGGGLSAEELEALIAPLLRTPTKGGVLPDAVLEATARQFGLTVRVLRSARRTAHLVRARQAAVFLLREHTGLSYPEIGALLGGRSHSTMIQSDRQARARLQQDLTWRHTLRSLSAQMESGAEPPATG